MADEDARLKVLIELGMTGDGAKQALAALDQLKDSTKKGGEETRKASDHTKEHNKHLGEMRKLARELDQLVPRLGLALKMAFSPQNLGIAIAIEAVRGLREGISSMFEEAKRHAEEAGKAMASVWAAQRDAAQELAEASKEFGKVMAEATDGINAKLEHQHALLTATNELLKQMPGYKPSQSDAMSMSVMERERNERQRQLDEQKGKTAALTVKESGLEPGAGRAAGENQVKDEKSLREAFDKAQKILNDPYFQGLAGGTLGLGRLASPEEMLSGMRAGKLVGNDVVKSVDEFSQFEKNREAIKHFEDLKKELASSRQKQVELTKQIEQLNAQMADAKTVNRARILSEAEGAFGTNAAGQPRVSNVGQLVHMLYPQMGARQQSELVFNLTHVTNQTDKVLDAIATFVLTHGRQIEDLKKRLDREGR